MQLPFHNPHSTQAVLMQQRRSGLAFRGFHGSGRLLWMFGLLTVAGLLRGPAPAQPLMPTTPEPAAPARAVPFRYLCWNIHHGEGMDGKTDLARIARYILAQKPDAVALQEVDRNCARTGQVDQAAELARLTGMAAVFQKAMDFEGGEYGICLLTRQPAAAAKGIVLPAGAEPRAAQWVRLAWGTRTLVLGNTHLDAGPEPGRFAQAQALCDALAPLQDPVLFAGDFNAVREDRVMRAFADSQWEIPAKQGAAATVPASQPRREIDFVLFRPGNLFTVRHSQVGTEAVASDHRPILLQVAVKAAP